MANLMIAHPQAPNAEAPKPALANVLPAGVKTAGKTAAQVKEEAKSASSDFEAKLKDGIESSEANESAKKETAKKAAMAAAVLGTQVPVQAAVQPKVGDGKATQAGEVGEVKLGKEGKPVINSALTAAALNTENKAATTAVLIDGKLVDAKSLAKDAKGEAKATEAAAKTAVKDNLNPLQQAMLTETKVAKPKGAVTALEMPAALQAMAGHAELEGDFEVESVDVKGGLTAGKTHDLFGKDAVLAKGTPTSKVSTSDYLNLRDLTKPTANNSTGLGAGLDLGTALKAKDGKKDKLQALNGREAFTGMLGTKLEVGAHGKTIDAPVTQGSLGKNVLTHDAVHQMTQQVNLMNKAQEDGEIKIRLRPDHLGELSMHVKSQGNQVSIEIKAASGESRKIIEESIASLKDSLAQQNLTLARVDIVNAPTQLSSAADQGMQMDMSQFRQNSGQNSSERGFDQGTRQERPYDDMSAPVNLNTVRRSAQASARGGQGLDLIA
jgi:hypothetical protein